MSFIGDFHFTPELEFSHSKESEKQKRHNIRNIWTSYFKKEWEKDACKNVHERLELDNELVAFSLRGFKDPIPVIPEPGNHVWFERYKQPVDGWVSGFSIEKNAYLVVNGKDEYWVSYQNLFAEKEYALVDALRAYARRLCSIYPVDRTRVDPFTDWEIEDYIASRKPVRRAISYILAQLYPLYKDFNECEI